MEIQPTTAEPTILVVDDENLVRSVAVRLLRQRGFRTMEAKDGLEAVDLILNNGDQIDAVLLDLTMPVMGGEEAFGRIRRLNPTVPIVLSSGFTEKAVSARFESDPPDGFLQKPFTAIQLTEAVQRALEENPVRLAALSGNPAR